MNITPAFKKSMLDAKLALGTPKLMILNPTHVEDLTTQLNISDVNANEIAVGGDYTTTGGLSLVNLTTVISGTSVVFDFDNMVLTGIDSATQGNIHTLLIYIDTGDTATSEIISQKTLATDKVLAPTDNYTLTVNSSGFIVIN